jgi:hypothetical protein
VLEAQRAGDVEERALDCWRGGGMRGAAAAAALERGRAPSGSAGEGERRRAVGTGEASSSRKPETREVSGSCVWKGFTIPNGPWAGLGYAGHQVDRLGQLSRHEKSSRQLVGRLARKVESDSPVGIPGAPCRLVDDLKTRMCLLNLAGLSKLSSATMDVSLITLPPASSSCHTAHSSGCRVLTCPHKMVKLNALFVRLTMSSALC